ncbi:MAG TPA: rhomboid family intramembrane serine protease [Ktedonobacterales bacterium]
MDVPIGATEYIEQGKKLLLQGQPRDAAVAFAHAVKIDPNLVGGHLGLAQANLALGSYGLVHMACQKVQELQPSGPDAELARAILFVMDRRYDRAIDELEKVNVEDPNRGYAQAMRGYCLRQLGRDYEAALAEAKAARLAGNIDFASLFPKATPVTRLQANPTTAEATEAPRADPRWQDPPPQPAWQPPSQIRRQVVRARFATRGTDVVTFSLIIINVLIYAICAIMAGNIIDPTQGHNTFLYDIGIQYTPAILQGHEYWRILTAMFLHASWLHIGVNMLSLYFIGRLAERVFGPWRYLLIYFGAGIFGGILTLFIANPNVASLGASGAIFGVFGALGVFFWLNRRALGGMTSQWIFWLLLNLSFTFYFGNIAVSDHIGGLSMGLLLGLLTVPGFWTPIRIRMKRGQTSEALLLVVKPLLVIIAISAALILLAYFLGGGR